MKTGGKLLNLSLFWQILTYDYNSLIDGPNMIILLTTPRSLQQHDNCNGSILDPNDVNSLAPGKCDCNSKYVRFKLNLAIGVLSTSRDITYRQMRFWL